MAAPSTGNDYAPCHPYAVGEGEDTRYRCKVHGGWYSSFRGASCQTTAVLSDVKAERARQFAAYGTNEDLEDGTGPDVRWLDGSFSLPATQIQEEFRTDYEKYEARNGKPTWMHLVREEIAESFAETDPKLLRAELIQAAALCVSWVEKLDARSAS